MILFNPSHIGLAFNGREPSAVNYTRLLYGETVKFETGENYWGEINQAFVTDGEQTYTTDIDLVELTPGTVLTVESSIRAG